MLCVVESDICLLAARSYSKLRLASHAVSTAETATWARRGLNPSTPEQRWVDALESNLNWTWNGVCSHSPKANMNRLVRGRLGSAKRSGESAACDCWFFCAWSHCTTDCATIPCDRTKDCTTASCVAHGTVRLYRTIARVIVQLTVWTLMSSVYPHCSPCQDFSTSNGTWLLNLANSKQTFYMHYFKIHPNQSLDSDQ